MASTSQSADIPDNHRDSWLALLSAAEAYCQKSGCDLAILTAWKKFPSGGGAFPKECDFSYSVWGQGFLAESARRYVDDISVLHSTTMLMAHKHTRQAGEGGAKALADLSSEPGPVLVSGHVVRAPRRRRPSLIQALVHAESNGRWRRGRSQSQQQGVLPKLPVHLQLGRRGQAGGRPRRGAGQRLAAGEAALGDRRRGRSRRGRGRGGGGGRTESVRD